ncbi:hypothetical protein AB3S75_004936 [Citrus x aurantiifolia]
MVKALVMIYGSGTEPWPWWPMGCSPSASRCRRRPWMGLVFRRGFLVRRQSLQGLAYSPAQESIAELQSKEEYESCNVSNPIRMYTDGLDVIPLDGEGIRYFVSSKYDNCKNGLKLHVNVLPQPHQSSEVAKVTAAKRSAIPFAVPPTTPSDSTRFRSSFILFFVRLGLFYVDL